MSETATLPFVATRDVTAELNYIAAGLSRPRSYTFPQPDGAPLTNIVNDPRHVTIRDARAGFAPGLDREGFALIRHPSDVHNFYDDAEVRTRFYPEVKAALAAATGADRVEIFDHTVRRRIQGAEDRGRDLPRQPVARVHVDHTEWSGPQRVRDLLPDEADALLRGRVQIVNLWRPIVGPLRDSPLAVADARTVAPADLVGSDLVYPDRVGETYSVRYNPAHRWFYVPDMRTDEALLLKCYDSATDGRARFAPHTAFRDPTAGADVRPRESIEVRALLFHTR